MMLPVLVLMYFILAPRLCRGLDPGEGAGVEDAPADIHLAAEINLVVALQIAERGVVVRVAVTDDLDGDLLGIAPLEHIGKVADERAVEAVVGADGGVDVHFQAVDVAGVPAPGEIGIKTVSILPDQRGELAAEDRRKSGAGDIAIAAFNQRNRGIHLSIRVGFGRLGHDLRDLAVEVVGADDRGCGARTGIDAVHAHQVKAAGKVIPCTPKEVEILHMLTSNVGQVFSREQILSRVWGYDYFGDTRTVDAHIKRIRQKLPQENVPWALKTVYGVGYRFEVNA